MSHDSYHYLVDVVQDGEVIGRVSVDIREAVSASGLSVTNVSGLINDTYEGIDQLENFNAIRDDLAKQSKFLACKGSLNNVLASGMLRDWGQGLSAYQHDETSLEKTQVPIYGRIEPGEIDRLCSRQEQEDYMLSFVKRNRERLIARNKKLDVGVRSKD